MDIKDQLDAAIQNVESNQVGLREQVSDKLQFVVTSDKLKHVGHKLLHYRLSTSHGKFSRHFTVQRSKGDDNGESSSTTTN
jgi:hypothetical protein